MSTTYEYYTYQLSRVVLSIYYYPSEGIPSLFFIPHMVSIYDVISLLHTIPYIIVRIITPLISFISYAQQNRILIYHA